MSELPLAGLLMRLQEQLDACDEQGGSESRFRADSVELDLALRFREGADGQCEISLAEDATQSAEASVHRARIRFSVSAGGSWQPGDQSGETSAFGKLPWSRDALMPAPAQSDPVTDPEFSQSDFDRMMDEIEGVSKKKKKRKKS